MSSRQGPGLLWMTRGASTGLMASPVTSSLRTRLRPDLPTVCVKSHRGNTFWVVWPIFDSSGASLIIKYEKL